MSKFFLIELKLWLFLTFLYILIWISYLIKYFIWYFNKIKISKKEIKTEIIEIKEDNQYQDVISVDSPLDIKKLEEIKLEALAYKEKWDLDLYEQKLIEWLSYDPNNLTFLTLLADYYFYQEKYNKALPLIKKILENIDDDKYYYNMAIILIEQGDTEWAKLMLEKALNINKNVKYYLTLAEIYYNQNDILSAINQLKECVLLRPWNVKYLLSIAKLYEELGDEENSKLYYEKVLQFDPMNEIARKKFKSE